MTAVEQLDDETFPAFVADLWARQGWTTKVREVDGESYVVAVREGAGERGLIWVKSGSTGTRVQASAVAEFASFCRDRGVDDAAIITLGAFTEDGEAAAEKFGIELLDGEGLARVVERHDLTDLVEEHVAGEESDGDGPAATVAGVVAAATQALSAGDPGRSPAESLSSVRERLGVPNVQLPSQVGVAAVVVVALVVAGVIVGPSLPVPTNVLGGDGGDDAPSMDVSAGPVQPGDATATLYVEYNAESVTTIDANRSDDRVHVAPNGTRFVVVQLSIMHTGGDAVDLHPAMFTLAANGTVYRYQPLSGVTGFEETTLVGGDSYDGWTAFVVPEDAPQGTLDVDQGAVRGGVAVQFASNAELDVNVTA